MKVALYGMLTSLAMILSFVETLIPINMGIPGMKLGLANLVIIVALYTLGLTGALFVSFLRIILVAATFGNFSTLTFSIAGATISLVCMFLAKRWELFSMTGVSVIGGIMHNVGQIMIAAWIVGTGAIFGYLPFLMIAGVVSGALIGLLAALVIARIKPIIR